MAIAFFMQSQGVVSTGSDVTPDALNWGNISQTGTGSAVSATTSALAIAGIDTPITLRASWDTFGDGNRGAWVKNGVTQGGGSAPLDVTVNVGDTLAFRMALITGPTPESSSGTVTVTNVSDSGAAIDTFTYNLERV